jgi:hypothetical protein
MKRIIIPVIVILLALSVGCFYTGSGNVVTHEVNVSGFDKIEAYDGFDVNIIQGDDFSVVVSIDDNLVEHLGVVKKGDTLMVDMTSGKSFRNVTTLKAEITMPELNSLILNDGSEATATGSGNEIYIEANDGCDADLSAFQVKEATVKAIDGSGVTVNVSGSLDATADDGSSVYYLGDPADITTDVSDGSKVVPED